eukprot:s34_g5.t1
METIGNLKGPILCLHGPPGIGKTSLGRSLARAMGRKFHRIALGGVRDEAELRGHRRTYIGSIPGVIIQAFQTLGVNNPVILLDEVDKTSQNSMFNPQATLLEILDPEQNTSFKDHYLNTPFDLSQAIFICTANDASTIDRPLLDRMEVIDLAGYTVEEKVAIATSHLLPKQRKLHALEEEPAENGEAPLPRLDITSEALEALITRWTAESGVRSLERHLAQICRWAALRLQSVDVPTGLGRESVRQEALANSGPDAQGRIKVQMDHLPHILGVEHFEPDLAERLDVGVAMGLSVSAVGGQLLFIEATKTVGTGKLTVTGQLGKVMTESVETALSLLRGRFVRYCQSPASSEVFSFETQRMGPPKSTDLVEEKPPENASDETSMDDEGPTDATLAPTGWKRSDSSESAQASDLQVRKTRSIGLDGDGWSLQERIGTLLGWNDGARLLAEKLYARFRGRCKELPQLLQRLEDRWGFPGRLLPLLWAQLRRAAVGSQLTTVAGYQAPEFVTQDQWLEAFTRWLQALQARLGQHRVSRQTMVRRHQITDLSPEEEYYFQGPKLGEGAYGEVFAMFHRSLGVKRAVKIIRKSQLAISTGAVEDEAWHSAWELSTDRLSFFDEKPRGINTRAASLGLTRS